MARRVPAGFVRLTCSDPHYDRTVRLGPTQPKETGGGNSWEVVARPRQVAMTVYKGREPFELELPVLFDGYRGGRAVEGALHDLIVAMAGDDESRPSPWRIRGIPWLHADEWVLQSAEPGDEVIRRQNMARLRQSYVLRFVEYTPPQYVQLRARARQGARAKTSVYRVQKGDTPARVAHKRRCRWTDLRTLNPKVVQRANQALTVGKLLRVPVLKAPTKKASKRG